MRPRTNTVAMSESNTGMFVQNICPHHRRVEAALTGKWRSLSMALIEAAGDFSMPDNQEILQLF